MTPESLKKKQKMQKYLVEKYLITIYMSIDVVLIVLRMFQNVITGEVFRKNVQAYLYKQ